MKLRKPEARAQDSSESESDSGDDGWRLNYPGTVLDSQHEQREAAVALKQALETADVLAVATTDECRRSAAKALHEALERAELQVIGHSQMMTQEQSQGWMDEPLMLECIACRCTGEADTGEICPDGLCHECCDKLDCDCWMMPYCDDCDEQHDWLCPLGRCEARML